MVHIDLHRSTLIKILKAIYENPSLRTVLGFKGGTAALLFYNLPRFSVDLDFDLLDPGKKENVFEGLKMMLTEFGTLEEAIEKHYTLFFLLNYGLGERKLKVETSKRPPRAQYEVRHYLGIPMLVMKQEDMIAGKLSALLTRSRFATRDLFDLWFFLKNNWSINEEVVKDHTGLPLLEALEKALKIVAAVKKTEVLMGLGDLLDNDKQKVFVKEKLKEELIFLLKLYVSNIEKK